MISEYPAGTSSFAIIENGDAPIMIFTGEFAPHPACFTEHIVMGQSVVYVCEKMSV